MGDGTPLNLPEADVCRVSIFQDSGWEPTEATIREAFDTDHPVRKARILTETGVCDSIRIGDTGKSYDSVSFYVRKKGRFHLHRILRN